MEKYFREIALELNRLMQENKITDAVSFLEKATNTLLTLLGTIYFDNLKKPELSVNCLNLAAMINPKNWSALNNMVHVLDSVNHYDQALEVSRKALEECGDASPDPYYNAGVVLGHLKQHPLAAQMYEKALSLEDTDKIAYNLALAYLIQGDFKKGLKYYERRFNFDRTDAVRKRFPQPNWTGQSLENKRLLVFSEQGIGDLIQFSRFIPQIPCSDITVESQYPAAELLKENFNIKAIPRGDRESDWPEPVKEIDYVVSICSLASFFVADVWSIPNKPYLTTKNQINLPLEGKKIGFSWFGNPEHPRDNERSCKLERFLNLVKEFPQANFISLQKGKSKTWGDLTDQPIFQPKLNDMRDTVAYLKSLDLVITVDSALAHLAGAVGVPTWTLVQYHGDWRWMEMVNISPWYPTMRLFRQTTNGDWDSVFDRIKDELTSCLR